MKMIVLAAAAAAFLASAGMAHPHPEGGEKTDRVMVMTHVGEGKVGDVRTFRMHSGKGDIAFADCDGDKTEIQEGSGKEKTRIFVCGKSGMSREERAKRLEEVRNRLAQNDRLGQEHRARVQAALQEAIDRARAGK